MGAWGDADIGRGGSVGLGCRRRRGGAENGVELDSMTQFSSEYIRLVFIYRLLFGIFKCLLEYHIVCGHVLHTPFVFLLFLCSVFIGKLVSL